MKYTKKERLEIGRRIFEGEINRAEAALEYDIDMYTARDYMRLYKASQRLAAQASEAPADNLPADSAPADSPARRDSAEHTPADSPVRRDSAEHTPAHAIPTSKHSASKHSASESPLERGLAQANPSSKHSAGEAPTRKPYERMTKTELIRELRRLTQNPDKKDS